MIPRLAGHWKIFGNSHLVERAARIGLRYGVEIVRSAIGIVPTGGTPMCSCWPATVREEFRESLPPWPATTTRPAACWTGQSATAFPCPIVLSKGDGDPRAWRDAIGDAGAARRRERPQRGNRHGESRTRRTAATRRCRRARSGYPAGCRSVVRRRGCPGPPAPADRSQASPARPVDAGIVRRRSRSHGQDRFRCNARPDERAAGARAGCARNLSIAFSALLVPYSSDASRPTRSAKGLPNACTSVAGRPANSRIAMRRASFEQAEKSVPAISPS